MHFVPKHCMAIADDCGEVISSSSQKDILDLMCGFELSRANYHHPRCVGASKVFAYLRRQCAMLWICSHMIIIWLFGMSEAIIVIRSPHSIAAKSIAIESSELGQATTYINVITLLTTKLFVCP